jgi:hypothetical protein
VHVLHITLKVLSLKLSPSVDAHDIVVDGYNLGRCVIISRRHTVPVSDSSFLVYRDWLVGNATQTTLPSGNLNTSLTFSGSTSSAGYTYKTSAILVSGLLANTSIGVNHNTTVGINGNNAIDGLVAVLTVSITQQPPKTSVVHCCLRNV